MQIVLAKMVTQFSRPCVWITKPVALIWLNDGNESDKLKAQEFASGEGYTVFTMNDEIDPLGKAKLLISASN